MKTSATALLFLLVASGHVAISRDGEDPITVIKADRILDVEHGTYLRDSAIVVRRGRIEAIVRANGPLPSRATEFIDLVPGATVLPGLIDAHVHLALSPAPAEGATVHGAAEARQTLLAGFTTVRDLGAAGLANVELGRAIEAGRVPGPRVIAAGPGLGTPGGVCEQVFGSSATASSAEAAAVAARRLIDSGAGVIKICAGGGVLPRGGGPEREMPVGMARAIVDAARAHGIRVAAHATTPAGVMDAIEAGADSIEHGGVLDEATIGRLGQSGTALVPTLARLDWLLEQRSGQAGGEAARARLAAARDAAYEAVRRAVAANVRVVFGTDATVLPHGLNAREFRALSAIGLSPRDAIGAATVRAAALLGLADRAGRIAPGFAADLIAVAGNPLADLGELERVGFVMKQGRVYLDRLVRKTAASAPEESASEGFGRALEQLRQAAKIPGLSAAVIKHREVVFARGFGHADLERKSLATAETPYDIASVTKPISAVVALKLVEEGRLDLDRPIAEYSDWKEFCREFSVQPSLFARDLRCEPASHTLRHLLSHTATGQPGEHFSYNPILYSWASRPLKALTGAEFSSLVERYVFEPAGMTRSARRHRGLPLPPSLAAALAPPHRIDGSGMPMRAPELEPQGDGAAGGVISTALDLAKFDIALDGGKLISTEARSAMMSSTRSSKGDALPYGLGWFVQQYQGQTLVWHSGWWEDAYSALYLKVPARALTLILLANSEGLWWENALDKAEVEKSPFARAFLLSWVAPPARE